MDSFHLDLRYALRSLLSRPGFSLTTIVTLALGIGVNAVAFSAINALLLRPFDMPDADRLGWIMVQGEGNASGLATRAALRAYTDGVTALDQIAAEARLPVSVRLPEGTEQGWALGVTSNYLGLFGERPALGRILVQSDASGSDLVTVVSHRFWQERLDAPESLGGQSVVINGRLFSVVGVMPDSFQGPGGLFAPDFWIPLERADVLDLPVFQDERPWLTLFGRLSAGATVGQAEGELGAVAIDLARAAGAAADGRPPSARFYRVVDGHPELRGLSPFAWVALGVVLVVLLIACFNVAALMMARATERRREIGVRCAVGASRGRITRLLMTEGLVLATLSGLAALVVAHWSEALLATFSLPSPIPQRLHLDVDGTLVAFVAGLVLLAGILPALMPARQATGSDVLRAIRSESALGGRPSRARNAFVVAQIAGSTLFIVVALLLTRSFVKSVSTDTGFDTQRTAILQLAPTNYGYDADRSGAFFQALGTRLAGLPGVRHVALADRVPFYVGRPALEEFSADGADCASIDCRRAAFYFVGPGHFAALGVPIEAGREFTESDSTTGAPVVISRHLATSLWPGESAVGRSLRIGGEGEVVQVVGVAGDIKHRNMSEPPDAYIYRPLRASDYRHGLTVVVRTHDDPRLALASIREQVRALDPSIPVGSLATMEDRMKMPLWPARTAAGFFLICAALAVTLGAIGLFGVMYFAVSLRTREFGIQAALGATRRRILHGVLGEGLRLALPGVLLGAAGAYMLARLLSRVLFGVSAADPVSYAATAVIEVGVTLLACALPAYRATRVHPIEALR